MLHKSHTFSFIILLQVFAVSAVRADADPGDMALYESQKFVIGIGAAIVKFDS